jgi:hypothetical protein
MEGEEGSTLECLLRRHNNGQGWPTIAHRQTKVPPLVITRDLFPQGWDWGPKPRVRRARFVPPTGQAAQKKPCQTILIPIMAEAGGMGSAHRLDRQRRQRA